MGSSSGVTSSLAACLVCACARCTCAPVCATSKPAARVIAEVRVMCDVAKSHLLHSRVPRLREFPYPGLHCAGCTFRHASRILTRGWWRGDMALRLGSPDRRAILRGTSPDEPRRAEVVQRIVGTYAEMPALTLEIDDAARLFGFRIRTCEAV